MSKSVSVALTSALSDIWTTIQRHHPEVPDVILLAAPNMHAHRNVLGHFSSLRWMPKHDVAEIPDASLIHEVVVIAEHLNRDAVDVVGTLLHEAAHALNFSRKLKDCSKSQYHNQYFAIAAEELGLDVEQVAHYGFSRTSLRVETAARYAAVTQALDAVLVHRRTPAAAPPVRPRRAPAAPDGGGALPGNLPPLALPEATLAEDADTGGRYKKASCACVPPHNIRVARRTMAATTIQCGTCGERFMIVDLFVDE